ncbi:MAG TPA: imidazoleglycerol-phosphate dehydratase HisB [Candidatus Brocadiales bacterium]|nr:imidazoleglycerol-phosphate dehydratase HisB [Candidatus Brocadiales bacterium]
MPRTAQINRKTTETEISLSLELDGAGNFEGSTGIGFLDHMLQLLAKHGRFNLKVNARGDLKVDDHHTVEDVGICLGTALREALGDKKGIVRFGDSSVPMQESLANVAIDLGGRPSLVYHSPLGHQKIGDFDAGLVQEFLEALSTHAAMNLHINVPYGSNTHHIAEAIFKALAQALSKGVKVDERVRGVPSTKGIL